MQGLSDALVDIGEGTGETPAEEYAMMLEVTMADHPGRPCPPAFSWNAGMVMHILKSNPVLRELEHVQVDGPGIAYLFFYGQAGPSGFGAGCCRCCPDPGGGGFFRVDLALRPLYH